MRSRGKRENRQDNLRDAERFFARATRRANWCGPDAEAIVICIATAFATGGRRVRLPLREIALKAGVSVTTASETLKVLDNLGLLSVRQRGRSATRLHRPRYPETAPRRLIPPLPPRIWASGAQGHKRRVVFDEVRGAALSFGHLVEAVNSKVRRSASSIRNDLRELERIGLLKRTQRRGIRTWDPTRLLPEEVVEPGLLRRVAAREARIAAERDQWRLNGGVAFSATAEDRWLLESVKRAGEEPFSRELPRPDERGPQLSEAEIEMMEKGLSRLPLNDIIHTGVLALHLMPHAPSNPRSRILIRLLHDLGVRRIHRRALLNGLELRWEHILGVTSLGSYAPEKCGADEHIIGQYVSWIADRLYDLDGWELMGLYDELEMLGVTRREGVRRVMLEVHRREETIPDGRPRSSAVARSDRHPDCTALQLATLPFGRMTAFELDAALEYAESDHDEPRADGLRKEMADRHAAAAGASEDLYHLAA